MSDMSESQHERALKAMASVGKVSEKQRFESVLAEVADMHAEYKEAINPTDFCQDWTLSMIVHDLAAGAERMSYEAEHREEMLKVAAAAIEAVLSADKRWGGGDQ